MGQGGDGKGEGASLVSLQGHYIMTRGNFSLDIMPGIVFLWDSQVIAREHFTLHGGVIIL